MSIALVQESAKEVRRLAIAGSPLAVGDFRLKKLIAPLEQAGAKVPVFGQVAKAIGEVVNGTEADSAANLLNLSTLLNAILYTQGQSSAEGELREWESHATDCTSTRTTARVLKPLVTALSAQGAGRFEAVKTAIERGLFKDLRLVEPAIRALDDNYPEMAELVADMVLPMYGPGIAPLLKKNLDLKGKKSDGRRLRVLHRLDPAGTVELCKTAFDDGSPEVKVVAIGCLAKHEEHLPLVLEQAGAKNKSVRAAALDALAEHDRPEVVALFMGLLKGKSLEPLALPFRRVRSARVLEGLLTEGREALAQALKSDEAAVTRFWEVLACLDERKEAEVQTFLIECFGQSAKLAKVKAPKQSTVGGPEIQDRLANLVYHLATPKTLSAILEQRDSLPAGSFEYVLNSAMRTWPAARVYEEFSPLLAHRKGAGKQRGDCIQQAAWIAFHSSEEGMYGEAATLSGPAKPADWDPRWLDAAIKADDRVMVCSLARPNHKGATQYLTALLKNTKDTQPGLALRALARCEYPKLTEAFLDAIKARTAKGLTHNYFLYQLFEGVKYLPVADLPRLDAFAATLDEKLVDGFLEALGPLRAKASAGESAAETAAS